MQDLTEAERAWIAGFLDADGSIGKYGDRVKISFSQNNLSMLQRLRSELGLERLRISEDRRSTPPVWTLQLQARKDVEKLLALVRPYLRHPVRIQRLEEIAGCSRDAADVG